MILRHDEIVDGREYCVVVFNAGRWRTEQQFVEDMFEGFRLPMKLVNADILDDYMYHLRGNIIVRLVKSAILKRRDEALYAIVLETLQNYSALYERCGLRFEVELS